MTQPTRADAEQRRRWSISDPVWYLAALLAIVGAELIGRYVFRHVSGVWRDLLGFPLALFLASVAYERARLRASWRHALAVGLILGGATIVVGWLTARS